jgi:hypothetical protein
MVYSHVDNTNGNSATQDNVTLNITLPAGWTNARAEHWVVDRTHSNSYQTWVGLGSPANPSEIQWTTIANAANLAHYDSASTVAISGGTYSKTFTQNYYSVGLIQLTNPAVGIINRTGDTRNVIGMIKTRLAAGTLTVDAGITGRYEIALYSVKGQRVKTMYAHGPGTTAISLHSLPAGAYLLECAGQSGKTAREIMIGSGN